MSTGRTLSIDCTSSDATEAFGEKLGQRLRGGEVIELVSDLGGGKTTLVRGISRGAGSSDVVGSPTFMISKVYKTQKFYIHHFDFYRLNEAGVMEYELQNVLNDPKAIVIIEWGEVVAHVLPANRLTINIRKTSDETRQLSCAYPSELAYLVSAA
ncbi:MAG: tRNA (adenosine(37)-N6)-threonylcarbamoyltransferase complex ATPase subunit type 1 TsaE [Patescibacteria group bacterium]